MTIERATTVIAWIAGFLLGAGLVSQNWFLSVAGGILMLVVAFGLAPMFRDGKGDKP